MFGHTWQLALSMPRCERFRLWKMDCFFFFFLWSFCHYCDFVVVGIVGIYVWKNSNDERELSIWKRSKWKEEEVGGARITFRCPFMCLHVRMLAHKAPAWVLLGMESFSADYHENQAIPAASGARMGWTQELFPSMRIRPSLLHSVEARCPNGLNARSVSHPYCSAVMNDSPSD